MASQPVVGLDQAFGRWRRSSEENKKKLDQKMTKKDNSSERDQSARNLDQEALRKHKTKKVSRKQKKDESKSWPKHPVTDWVLSNGAKTLRATEKAYRVTGLDEYDRTSIWNLLGTAKFKLSMLGRNYTSGSMRSVSIDCQFLLTLAILRRNYEYIEVICLFISSQEPTSRYAEQSLASS